MLVLQHQARDCYFILSTGNSGHSLTLREAGAIHIGGRLGCLNNYRAEDLGAEMRRQANFITSSPFERI